MARILPYQPSLFPSHDQRGPAVVLDLNRGKELAVVGMELAKETANKKEKGWSKICWQLFLVWLRRRKGKEFMIEDFRAYLYEYDLIAPPPSQRAFGFVSHRASREGYIIFLRTEKVKNKKAHGANAAVWKQITGHG